MKDYLELKLCGFIDICIKRKELRDKDKPTYCYESKLNTCRCYEFYKNYGEDYNFLGIGA